MIWVCPYIKEGAASAHYAVLKPLRAGIARWGFKGGSAPLLYNPSYEGGQDKVFEFRILKHYNVKNKKRMYTIHYAKREMSGIPWNQ